MSTKQIWLHCHKKDAPQRSPRSQRKTFYIKKPLRSLIDLQGLGKEVWEDVNVDEYIDTERNSWN